MTCVHSQFGNIEEAKKYWHLTFCTDEEDIERGPKVWDLEKVELLIEYGLNDQDLKNVAEFDWFQERLVLAKEIMEAQEKERTRPPQDPADLQDDMGFDF
jgi:hypothetical protein